MLTETAIRNAKPRPKLYKLSDSGGLQLHVHPNGSRLWRLAYRHLGKQKTLAIGAYPVVTLADARSERDKAKRLLWEGKDPSTEKQNGAAARQARAAITIKVVGDEYLEKMIGDGRADATIATARWHLEDLTYPYIGDLPIADATVPQLLAVLRRVEARGHRETALKMRSLYSRIFRYAVATGRAERDIAADMRGALKTPQVRHFAAITDERRIGLLLRAIDEYEGYYATRYALRLAPYLFVRPGELRAAEWGEFDLSKAVWSIPAAKMKMKRPHIVPLAPQVVEVLRSLHEVNGEGKFLFPAIHTTLRTISENTLNVALRRMGYTKEEMTSHGFRTMASTRLNEAGFNADLIERQLAHIELNKVRRAYNAAEYLDERRKMMEWWADRLDTLRTG